MPVPAVPAYLNRILSGHGGSSWASPALRFGLLLPIWTSRQDQETEVQKRAAAKSREGEKIRQILASQGMDHVIEWLVGEKRLSGLWEKNDFGARSAWQRVAQLTPDDKARMRALADRQKALWQKVSRAQALRLEAVATAPFTTGLGNEHPLENGFAFLNPYGLPYLPGSGVKGVLRQAAGELARGLWGDSKGWSEELCYDWPLKRDCDRPPPKLSMLDVLFGRETPEGEREHLRGALVFWDAIPQIAGDGLLVEIMTPHYTHYYQQKKKDVKEQQPRLSPPHDSGQPNPICFLTVPPGSRFVFHVTCDVRRLERIAEDLAREELWKKLLVSAFEHAFQWLGFGAKTAVGYGAMRLTEQAAATSSQVGTAGQAPPARLAEGPPAASVVPGAEKIWDGATLKFNPSDRSIQATLGRQTTAPLRGRDAEALLNALGAERADKLRARKSLANVRVKVEQLGNLVKLLGLAE